MLRGRSWASTLNELDLRLQQVDEALQDPSVRPDWLDPDRPPRLFNRVVRKDPLI